MDDRTLLEKAVPRIEVVGPVVTARGLRCAGEEFRCRHFHVYDWHYEYCSAQPDTAAALRPGAGTHLHGNAPNSGCPYRTPASLGDKHE